MQETEKGEERVGNMPIALFSFVAHDLIAKPHTLWRIMR
jgi:hypothetical protein